MCKPRVGFIYFNVLTKKHASFIVMFATCLRIKFLTHSNF